MGDNTRISSLEDYSSLTDPHLASYFSNGRIKQQLHRAGLIKRNGELVSETTYQLNVNRKNERRKEKELLLRAIDDKKRDLEREQYALVIRTMDSISKMENVLRIKTMLQSSKKEQRLPSLARLRSAPEGRQFRVGAIDSSSSCIGQVGGTTAQRQFQDRNTESDFDTTILDLFDIDSEKRRIVQAAGRAGPIRLYRPKSPYTEKRIPRALLPPQPQKNSKTKNRPLSPARKKSSNRREAKKPRVIKRSGGMLEYTGASADQATVTLRYHGMSVNLEPERVDPRDDVLVEQQHCGGNTLIVYRKRMLPGDQFSFVSRRHDGFPFSTTIYVNGATDYRVSACCEYRHRLTARLGSKGGHFSVVKVKGGAPCARCLAKYAKKHGGKEMPWNYSSDSDDDDDDMLYIPVESDDEDINVRPADSESDYSSYSDDSDGDDEDEEDASESESSGGESHSEVQNGGGLEIPAPSISGNSLRSPSPSSDRDLDAPTPGSRRDSMSSRSTSSDSSSASDK